MTIHDIAQFMEMGGQAVPEDVDPDCNGDLFDFVGRIIEEINETQSALLYGDDAEIVDGFLDIAYAAFTGAIRKAGADKAAAAWDAICDANLAKVDGRYGPVVTDPDTGKILKPEGWQAPDIEAILND